MRELPSIRQLRERLARWLAPAPEPLDRMTFQLYPDELVVRLEGKTPYHTFELRVPRPVPDTFSLTLD